MSALAERFLEGLEGVRKTSDGWMARCPAHDDRNPSLKVKLGNKGLVLTCHAGCAREEVVRAQGWTMADLFYDQSAPGAQETYDYTDEAGDLLFQVIRRPGKQFRQRHADGSWQLGDVRRVLYRLPAVVRAVKAGKVVWIVEGEKDVHALERVGMVATCNPGGAGKWRETYTKALRGASVVVCGDCDDPGRNHVQQVAQALDGAAREVRVLDLDSSRADGYDIADFLSDARTDSELNNATRVLARAALDAPVFLSTTKGSGVVETKPKGLLPFAPMAQALADVPEEPEWTWDGYAAPGALTLLAGRPKVGKSTLVFGAVEAVSAGRPFLERETAKSSVLLLSEERQNTLAEKQRRFNLNGSVDLLMRHQVAGAEWPEVVDQAVAYCQLRGIRVLIVDTWDKWAGLTGDAENSAGHVLTALEPLQRAAAQGLTVLIVAHQRKAAGSHGEAVRGNNALTGSVDVIVEVERPTSDVGPGVRVLKAVSRFSATPEELAAELTEDGYEARGDEDAVRDRAEKARAWDAVASLGAATVKQVAELCDMSDSTVRRRLEQLVQDDAAIRDGEGGKADPFTWRVIGSTSPYSLGGGKKETAGAA